MNADEMQQAASEAQPGASKVVIVALDLPFWNLVGFLIKLAFAAVPAGIIVSVVGWFFWLAAVATLNNLAG